MHTTTGVFVCFEGGEGAGKSTQARALAGTLTDGGFHTLLTFEPGDTAVGKEMRRIVLDPATGELSHRTEVLLYAADKSEHVDTVVLPALERGEVVITDRYVDSMLAYQGAGRSARPVGGRARRAVGHPRPAPAPDRRSRPRPRARPRPVRRARPDRGRVARLLRPGARGVPALAAADPDHYLVVDASRPAEEIAAVVLDPGRAAAVAGGPMTTATSPPSGTRWSVSAVPSSRCAPPPRATA